MDKGVLKRYNDLIEEQAYLAEKIKKLRSQIIRDEDLIVSDSVKGTRRDGTYGSIRITGFPYADLKRKRGILKRREVTAQKLKEQVDNQLADVEEYQRSVTDSRMRRMIEYRFVQGLPWKEVAKHMGRKATADSCRMELERFLKEE